MGPGHLVVVAGLARRSARVAEIAVEDLEPVLVCYFARSCQQGYGSWDAKEGVAVEYRVRARLYAGEQGLWGFQNLGTNS